MNFNRLLFWYGLAAVLSTLFWAITVSFIPEKQW